MNAPGQRVFCDYHLPHNALQGKLPGSPVGLARIADSVAKATNCEAFPLDFKGPVPAGRSNYAWKQNQTGRAGVQPCNPALWAKATGYGLFPTADSRTIIVDVDDPALIPEILKIAPRLTNTFADIRGEKPHYFATAPRLLPSGHIKIERDGNEVASIRGRSVDGKLSQVAGPGSAHPSGEKRRMLKLAPLVQLSEAEFAGLLGLAQREYKGDISPLKGAPVRTFQPADDWQTKQIREWIEEYLDELKARRAGRNDFINDRTAWNIGRLAHYINADDHLMDLIFDAAVANGYVGKDGEGEARATIRSGFEAGKGAPRYPFKNTSKPPQPESAPQAESLTIRTPSDVTIGSLIRLLCSRNPERALTVLPIEERSRATVYRRSRTFNRSIGKGGTESENPVSESEIRETRIRILFPQADPVKAVIPLNELSTELFAGTLDESDIESITDSIELTHNEREAIKTRLGSLHKIERIERALERVPFEVDRPIKNLPDLRRMVYRQVMQHLVKTDPDTGEIVPTKLSNAVQAALIGVSIGAMAGIRAGAGVEQTAPPAQRKTFAKGENVPSKAYGRTYHQDGSVSAMVQDVARQHVVDLPTALREKKPRVEKPTSVSNKDRQKRRPPRQLYAAQLMRNILARFKVKASADEPLDELARKIRQAIEPDPLIDALMTEHGAVVVSEEQS